MPALANTSRFLASLADLLLPMACLGCGDPIRVLRPRLGLCAFCLRNWPRPDPSRCSGCGLRVHGAKLGSLCGACRRRRLPFQQMLIAWDYVEPVSEVIQTLKFHRLEILARDLADAYVEHLTEEQRALLRSHDAVSAVPLWWRRRLVRGYNQAELIARRFAHHLDLPYVHTLRRRRGGPPQSSRSLTQRRRNVRDAFRPIAGRTLHRVILVDDVVTSGATIEAAAKTLRHAHDCEAHNCTVTCVALARTPRN